MVMSLLFQMDKANLYEPYTAENSGDQLMWIKGNCAQGLAEGKF
jgi:hypothetical protein